MTESDDKIDQIHRRVLKDLEKYMEKLTRRELGSDWADVDTGMLFALMDVVVSSMMVSGFSLEDMLWLVEDTEKELRGSYPVGKSLVDRAKQWSEQERARR